MYNTLENYSIIIKVRIIKHKLFVRFALLESGAQHFYAVAGRDSAANFKYFIYYWPPVKIMFYKHIVFCM